MEAFFKNSEDCSEFSYQIKGINNQRPNGYNITMRAANDTEKKEISELIESSAENAYNIVTGKKVNEHEKN